jgi:tyrosyl-tRNA synthetase
MFQKGSIPTDIPERKLGSMPLVDLLLAAEFAKSKSEARRLIEQNGVKLDGATLTDPAQVMDSEGILQVGKRHFLKLVK